MEGRVGRKARELRRFVHDTLPFSALPSLIPGALARSTKADVPVIGASDVCLSFDEDGQRATTCLGESGKRDRKGRARHTLAPPSGTPGRALARASLVPA